MKNALVNLVNISKSFDNQMVLDDLNLYIRENEFLTLLGPSGCGKTTTLRILGGFETPDKGQVIFEGRDITNLPPNKRNLNTVFQKYALFPHMTIAENIAFGLKISGKSKSYINDKIKYALKLVNLDGFENRMPDSLSGGQQQRIAIARAIVNEPKLLLLDEPLGALDLKLRQDMQYELIGLKNELGITFIYVTHDQTEAMTLGDRIVVMNQGAVQQADTPQNLYAYPVNRFVAGFIGSPSMNFIKGLAMEKMGIPTFCTEQDGDIPIPDFLWKILKRQGYIGRNIELGIRPEHFLEKPAGADTRGEWKMEVTVTARELLGAEVILHFNHNGQDCCAKVSGDSLIDKGDSVTLWIDMAYISAFDMETQENITLKRGAFS